MPNTIPAAGEAMPAPVPTIYDVQIRLLELSTLLETLDEFAGEIHFDSNNSEEDGDFCRELRQRQRSLLANAGAG